MIRGLMLLCLLACANKRVRWDDPGLSDVSTSVVAQAPIEVLRAGASDDDPSNRGRAIALLIRLSSEEASAWGQRALWDPDGWVQRQGVLALVERGADPAVLDQLAAYVRRTDPLADPYARGAAAIRLARLGRTEIRADVSRAWRLEPHSWRAAPLLLAAMVLGDADAREPLRTALTNADISLEPGFLVDLGTSELPALLDALDAGTPRVEEEMALAWVIARFLLGDPAGEREITLALTGDDALMGLEALDYLVEIPAEKVTKILQKARTSPNEIVRVCAGAALAGRGAAKADLLIEAAMNDDPEARAQAVFFASRLASLPDEDRASSRVIRKVLELTLDDERLDVRLAALRAATVTGTMASEAAIRVHMVDELLAVRIEAAGALLARGAGGV